MPSLTDVDDQTVVDVRTDVTVLGGHGGKREQTVQLGEDVRIELHLRYPFAEGEHQLLIESVLDDLDTLLGRTDLLLVGLEFIRYIALGVDQRLLADPVGGHLFLVRVAHLEVVTEDVVKSYLETCDTGSFDLALLDLQQVVFPVRLDRTQFVEFGVYTTCDDVGSALYSGRVGDYLPFDTHAHLRARVELFTQKSKVRILPCVLADLLHRFDGFECAT